MQTQLTIAIASCGLAVSLSHAGIPVYTNEASFLNDLISPAMTEGYETYADDFVDGARTIELDYFNASFNGTSSFGVDSTIDIPNGAEPVEGDKHLRAHFGGGTQVTVSFEFDSPVEAFGTYYTDVELSFLSVVVHLDNGQSFNVGNLDTIGNGQRGYFGIQPILVGIESVDFTMSAHTGLDGVFFDQTTIAVPTPATLALFSTGLLFTTRRKR